MVYDADCPLCSAYTSTFISTKMLDENGRIAYQEAGGEFCPGMDAERAKNEIALINRATGQVTYGYESLLFVLGNQFGWIRKAAAFKPVDFLMRKLYAFISYNRKVILPAKKNESSLYDCTPTFNLKYRIAYFVFTWLITSLVLVKYSQLLGDLIPATNFLREFFVCGGQVIFQAASVGLLLRERGQAGEKLMNYLGNMMTVSFFGALLLLPALVVGSLLSGIPSEVFLIYFLGVAGVMLYEHMRRMKILQLGGWPSVSWVLYRVLVLAFILIVK